MKSSKLALHGGEPAVKKTAQENLFHWPIITSEDEEAVVGVMRARKFSNQDIAKEFESKYAAWQGSKYGLACMNGTAALNASFWACGIGAGDEVISPSMTYWATCQGVLQLGATVNFADIDPVTLTIDPKDIEHRIGPKTKAIIVCHWCGHPCDMDPIMEIAAKHNLKVIEDVSHAQGGWYKGRRVGTIGHISAASLMSGKAFPIGEGGIMCTDDRELYERCAAYGYYERTGGAFRWGVSSGEINIPELQKFKGLCLSSSKYRLNQTCAAMGLVQLKYYEERMAVIQKANNRFADGIEGLKGIRPHRVKWKDSTMGGWYFPRALFFPEELEGLDSGRFAEAVTKEGVPSFSAGGNIPLHLHAVFHELDFFNQGQPTAVAFGQRDVRQGPGSLPVTENYELRSVYIPYFRQYDEAFIDECAAAVRKVAENYKDLL